MLHALELENFKAFGKRARIPFAPITLIFGENSAGKSTILQVLYLLKQTLERGEAGTLLLPRTENGIVDLGSFQEMLFDHDLKRTLSIRVDTKLDRELGIEFSFKRPSLEEEVLLDQINIYDDKFAKCIAKFQLSATTIEPQEFWRMGFFRNPRPLPTSKLTAAKCEWLTEATEYWKPEFEWCQENKAAILREFEARESDLKQFLKLHEFVKNSNEDKRFNQGHKEVDKKIQEEFESLRTDRKFFAVNSDLQTYIGKRLTEEMDTVVGLQGFLPVGAIPGERSSWITGPRSLLRRQFGDTNTCDIAEFAMEAGDALEQTLKILYPISPFRKPPERWHIFRGNSPENVGYQGDLLPDLLFRHPELVKETNKWLKHLDMGYEIEVKPVGTDSGDFFEVRLIDTRRREPVSVALPDVGFGVSQLLPFIVQSLVSEKRIISIEQPEVHVHPKLQADLGDLLAEAIKKPRQNRFIIETHSEHLILRLQRLIRNKLLEPEDVSVIYVSRGPEGAKAERLRLDEDGYFIDNWPGGFFAERLRELR